MMTTGQLTRFALLLLLLTAPGCRKADLTGGGGEPAFLSFPDGKSVSFDEKGGEKALPMAANIATLRIAVSGDAAAWLTARLTPASVVFTAKANPLDDSRTAAVTVAGAGLSETLTVTQTGRAATIQPNAPEFATNEYGGEVTVEVTTNRDFDVVLPSDAPWITLEERAGENPVLLTFNIAPLMEGSRSASVALRAKDGSVTASVTITQTAGSGYEPQTDLVLPADFKVTPLSGAASSYQPGEGIENAFDGLFSDDKLYHSAWDNSPRDYFPITLEFTFDGAHDLSYLVYYPRQNGPNGLFKEIEVWGKGSDPAEYTLLKEIDLEGSAQASKVLFDRTLLGAESVKIIVHSGAGDGQGFASAREIEFYQNNPDKFDLLSVFTDTSASDLKPGITEEEIRRIAVPVYQQIAYHLLKGDYPREFRIDSFKAYPNPDDERAYNRTGYPLSLFDNPTGIVVREGQDLLVLVGPSGGRRLGLWVVNYDAPGGDGVNGRQMLPLDEGANLLRMPQDGHLYLAYNTPEWQTAPPVKVHFANGQVQGYFDSVKHRPEDYARILNGAVHSEFLDLLGQYAHLAFPVADFRAVVPQDGKGVTDFYDDLVRREFDFLGLFKYGREFHNRAFFSVHYNPDYYLYATSYHTAYSSGSIRDLINTDFLRRENWGLAHEMGHQLQTAPGLRWHGTTEVTNNIMSLYIQTGYGNTSRIQAEDPGAEDGFLNIYDRAYSYFLVPDYGRDPDFFYYLQPVPYLGRKNEIYSAVFEMLVPFWQLYLYFTLVKGNPDFYPDLYEEVRNCYEEDLRRNDGQVQADFARKASKAGGMDLTGFFEKWGFFREMNRPVNDYSDKQVVLTAGDASEAKDRIAQLGLPPVTDKIEYISDANWTFFRDRKPVTGSGSATLSGGVVTIPKGAYDGVVAYEFYLDGRLIAAANNPKLILPGTALTGDKKLYAVAFDGRKTAIPLN